MNIAIELAKELDCKAQDVKSLAKGLGLDLDKLEPSQHEGLAEAVALFKTGKTINEACRIVLDKAKGSITKAETMAPSKVVKPETVPMPDGLKRRLDSISTNQAVEGAPEAKDALAETFSGVSEKTLEAITGYAAHSYQEALMNELNKPEFLDELEKAIAEGKSQT